MCAMYLSVLSSATAADRQQIESVSFSSAAVMLDFKKIICLWRCCDLDACINESHPMFFVNHVS